MPLWEDHLLPLLRCGDAARLGCTCKALRGVVREHFKTVGRIRVDKLKEALTSFPSARTVALDSIERIFEDDTDGEALVQWLREGGQGRGLERMTIYDFGETFIHKALQAGALPSLKSVAAHLENPTHRASLTEGLVAAMHELHLTIDCTDDDSEMDPQLAALGLVRQLPALTKLELEVYSYGIDPVQWPPFTPPSLKSVLINVAMCVSRPCDRVLPVCPPRHPRGQRGHARTP
jgi:hypothetical protein